MYNRGVESRTGVEERERDLGLRELWGDCSEVVEQRERNLEAIHRGHDGT